MAKVRIKCHKCGTYNYLQTTFCASCGEKLKHHPKHTVMSENVPKLPAGEAKKKADFYAPNEKKKPAKKILPEKKLTFVKNFAKAMLFSVTLIFIGLIIYPPQINSPEPKGTDIDSFDRKANAYIAGEIKSVTFTEPEIAAFLHVKALQPTILQNKDNEPYFVFPSKVQINIFNKGFKLYLSMSIYGIDIIIGIKGEILVKRDGHLYLTLKSLSLGRLPIPKTFLTQMVKSMQVAFKYPLPNDIADIALRENNVFVISQTMRSPKRRVRREKDLFNYTHTDNETISEPLDSLEEDFDDAEEDFDNDEDFEQAENKPTKAKFKIKKVSTPDTEQQSTIASNAIEEDTSDELTEDALPQIEETTVEDTNQKPAEKQKQETKKSAPVQHAALSPEEEEDCRKIKLKGDFLYSRKQYRPALIYYNKIIRTYPNYKDIEAVKDKIKDIETNH